MFDLRQGRGSGPSTQLISGEEMHYLKSIWGLKIVMRVSYQSTGKLQNY